MYYILPIVRYILYLHFRAFIRRCCLKQLTVIHKLHSYSDGGGCRANQHIRSSLGFSDMHMDTRHSGQRNRSSDLPIKTLALPLSLLYTAYYTVCSRRPFVLAVEALVRFPAWGPLLRVIPSRSSCFLSSLSCPINKAIQKSKNNLKEYYILYCTVYKLHG